MRVTALYNNMGGYQMGYTWWDQFWNEWVGRSIDPDPATKHTYEDCVGVFLLKILGLLLTAFALQLGSNYWFDLLNKAVNLRATGKKPNDKKNK